MKDFLSLCGFVAGKTYSAVNTSKSDADAAEQRRGSLVVNRSFDDPKLQQRRRTRCSLFLMLAGILSISTGCLMLVLKPYDLLFRMKIMFFDGGESFELWRKPPVDLYLKVYLFNITNSEAFLRGEEKMKVEEVGPYIYKELLEHANVTFNDNGTLSMVPKHPLVWVPEMNPVRREDDLLVLANIALLSITHVMSNASYFTRMGLNLLIAQTASQPLVKMTAREFMFGYQSTLTTLGNTFMPSWIYFDKVGLVDRMYDFDGDTATVFTGEKHLGKAGLIESYRGSPNLPQWHGDHCSSVVGTSDASKFASLIKPEDDLSMYRKSVCRAMPMVRTGETFVNGLKAYKYKFQDGILDNGHKDPRNKCFCRNGYCLKEGLIDVTDCYYGFPIAVSYPHFYNADPSLLEGVDGSHPDQEKHESQFLIQPDAGLPLQVKARFQINMAIGDVSGYPKVKRFSNLVFPMLWSEVGMYELPVSMNSRYYLYLNILPVVEQAAVYFTFIVGTLFLTISMIRILSTTLKTRRQMCDFAQLPQPLTGDAICNNGLKTKEMNLFYSSLLVPTSEIDEEEDDGTQRNNHIEATAALGKISV